MAVNWDAANPANNSGVISDVIRNMWESIQQAKLVNLLEDPKFEIWPFGTNGASHRPAYWGGFTAPTNYQLITAGIGEQSNKACRITVNAVTQRLGQKVLSSGELPDEFRGSVDGQGWFSIGANVKSGSSAARISLFDGVGRNVISNTHTGGGSFEWLSGVGHISSSATELRWDFEPMAATGDHDITECVLIYSPIPPGRFIPPNSKIVHFESMLKEGTFGTPQPWWYFYYHRPLILRGATITMRTAPTGSSVIADVNVRRGGTQVSVFQAGSRPTVTVGNFTDTAAVDSATYSDRCVNHFIPSDADRNNDSEMSMNVDQADSNMIAADPSMMIYAWKTESPLEFYRVFDHTWQ